MIRMDMTFFFEETPNNQFSLLWLFQLDDSKSLHKKWLFHQTSIKKWLLRVPGKRFQTNRHS